VRRLHEAFRNPLRKEVVQRQTNIAEFVDVAPPAGGAEDEAAVAASPDAAAGASGRAPSPDAPAGEDEEEEEEEEEEASWRRGDVEDAPLYSYAEAEEDEALHQSVLD
jgi:hypothetical protein